MVADISQASTLPVGPTRFAARIVWLPAPQARSRTRMPGRTPAISISVSVADDRPAENSRSHFAQPGAAFSQLLRSSDFAEVSVELAIGFPLTQRSNRCEPHELLHCRLHRSRRAALRADICFLLFCASLPLSLRNGPINQRH